MRVSSLQTPVDNENAEMWVSGDDVEKIDSIESSAHQDQRVFLSYPQYGSDPSMKTSVKLFVQRVRSASCTPHNRVFR